MQTQHTHWHAHMCRYTTHIYADMCTHTHDTHIQEKSMCGRCDTSGPADIEKLNFNPTNRIRVHENERLIWFCCIFCKRWCCFLSQRNRGAGRTTSTGRSGQTDRQRQRERHTGLQRDRQRRTDRQRHTGLRRERLLKLLSYFLSDFLQKLIKSPFNDRTFEENSSLLVTGNRCFSCIQPLDN